jgi:hypothetical protein
VDVKLGWFNGNTAKDVALTSLLAGGASGAVVCVGSAPFELVKVGPSFFGVKSWSWKDTGDSLLTTGTGPETARVSDIPGLPSYAFQTRPSIHLGPSTT